VLVIVFKGQACVVLCLYAYLCVWTQDNRLYARPEDVVRHLESLLRAFEDLSDTGARLGGRQGEALHDDCMAQVRRGKAAGAVLSCLLNEEHDMMTEPTNDTRQT
jgi:hypothetical protein